MKNKELFQQKVTRLESMMNSIHRAVNVNDRSEAQRNVEASKELLSDLQTMLNRETTTFS